MSTRKARSKLLTFDDAQSWQNKILTFGHFSSIHPGHIRYLRHASSLGSELIVALIGDNSSVRYPFSQVERANSLALLDIVSGILLLNGDELDKAIEYFEPATVVLGIEYKNNPDFEHKLTSQRDRDGLILYHAGDPQYATSDLLIYSEAYLREQRHDELINACKRQDIDAESINSRIHQLSNAKLAVIGDTILDQYVACEALGMSAEAPVVVVRELDSKDFAGGASVVASHISALGAECHFVSVTGDDAVARNIHQQLNTRGITSHLIADSTRPTTFKKRYIVENQKLFRVSRLEEHLIDESIENKIKSILGELAPSLDAIIVSDFVYGVITPTLLEYIKTLADKFDLMLFGDVQCSSQVGLVTNFSDFTLLTPNEKEARIALQARDMGLEQLSQALIKNTNSRSLIMKLGPHGFITYDRRDDNTIYSQAFPALSINPVDVAGAGDSLLALFSTALVSGFSIMEASAMACCMSALAVDTMGNTPIEQKSLKNYFENVFQIGLTY